MRRTTGVRVGFWTAVAVVALGWAAPLRAVAEDAKLVVHEWGVMVKEPTTIGTRLGPPTSLGVDLPTFVLRHGHEYTPERTIRPWKKPVIHLYGPEGMQVTVQVLTAKGRPVFYYPKPRLLEETFWNKSQGVNDTVGMEWSGKLTAAAPEKPARVDAGNWWATARSVPSMYLQTSAGTERFIFYEATAFTEPPLTGAVQGDELTLTNADANESGPVAVILNDGQNLYCQSFKAIAAKGNVKLQREALLKTPAPPDVALDACRAQWKALGMTDAEAQAIVEIWKHDLTERLGFLVVFPMPAATYEQMFPMTVTPKPQQTVRVGMVLDTLAGQKDRAAWLPGLRKLLEPWGRDLASDDYKTREEANTELARLGDLAQLYLEELAQSGDTEVSTRAKQLLANLQPVKAEPLPTQTDRSGKPLK